MKKYRKIILFAFAALFVSAMSGHALARDDIQSMKSEVSEELLKVKTLSEEIKWQVDEANKRTADVEKQLDTLKSRIIDNNKVIEQKLLELKSSIAAVDSERIKNEEEITRKIQVILDEVTKENERILSKVEGKSPKSKKEAKKQRSVRTASPEPEKVLSPEEVHVVGEGESLSKIARGYGISVRELMESNGIEDPNSIRFGQKLKVPQKGSDQ